MKLPHRDDFDDDMIEEIEAAIEEVAPGHKMVFAGDMPGEPPPEALEKYGKLQSILEQLALQGRCIDCGVQMDNWPPPDDKDAEWDLQEGWELVSQPGSDTPLGLTCVKCKDDHSNAINIDEFIERMGPIVGIE